MKSLQKNKKRKDSSTDIEALQGLSFISVHRCSSVVANICAFVCSFSINSMAEDGPIVYDLEPFYITAYRAADDSNNYPGNVTVFDEAFIQDSGLSNVAELLETYAGVNFRSFSGNSSSGEIDLRGYGEGSGLRTLILVDGQKLNRPDLNVPTWLEIPIGQIERVEVLRGAQTARFGDHAVGGVINIITKLGLEPGEKANRLEVVYGSYDTHAVRATHRGRLFDWNYTVSLEDNRTNGYRDNGGHDVTGGIVNFGREFGDLFSTRVGISFFDEKVEFPGPLSESDFRENPRQTNYAEQNQARFYFSEGETVNVNGTAKLAITETASIQFKSGFSQRDQVSNLGPGSHFDNLLRSFSFEPQINWKSLTRKISMGVNFNTDNLDIKEYADINRTNLTNRPELNRGSMALYAYGDQVLFETITLSGAVRWESIELEADTGMDNQQDMTSNGYAAQLGINGNLNESWRTWLRYDLLYRFPVTDEIASYQGFPLARPFNENLDAEKGHNIELGVQFSKNSWNIKANLFAQWLNGEIAYDFNDNLNVNLADTRRIGIELSSMLDFKYFEFQFFYTWLQAEYRNGDYQGKEVYLVPNHKLSGVVTLTPTQQLKVQVEYQYTSDAFEGNDFENKYDPLPGSQVVNLMVRHQIIDDVSLFVRVNNILDEKFASLKYSGVWYPAPGRNAQVGCSIVF